MNDLSKERHQEQKWFHEKGYSAGFRAGVKKVSEWVRKHSSPGEEEWWVLLDKEKFEEAIRKLLTEGEEE